MCGCSFTTMDILQTLLIAIQRRGVRVPGCLGVTVSGCHGEAVSGMYNFNMKVVDSDSGSAMLFLVKSF